LTQLLSDFLNAVDLGGELFLSLVQRLEAKLPASQLNAELIDLAGDFRSLGSPDA
jgi:hypothetical protein